MSGNRAPVDLGKAAAAVRLLLEAIGEDPERDGLTETPARVARSYAQLLHGYSEDPGDHLNRQFEVDHDEMVIVRNIAFSSMCEHHLLPFIGTAHIAYIPGEHGRVCGLCFARTQPMRCMGCVDVGSRRRCGGEPGAVAPM